MLFAYGLGNEYRLTARVLDSCVLSKPTLIGFGDAERRSTYRSSSFISFAWIIVAVTAAIRRVFASDATSTRAPIAYRTRRAFIEERCYFVVDPIDERLMLLFDVDR